MQAGHSDGEQHSRDEQVRQLAECILRPSGEEARWVVVEGDMNMGPSRNADLQGYTVHYSSLLDARRRDGSYEVMKKIANVRDVICPGWEQDINRVFVREIEQAEVGYLEKPRYDKTELNMRHASLSEIAKISWIRNV